MFWKFKFGPKTLHNTLLFYSLLTGKKSNNEEYEHVLNVWNKFEMKRRWKKTKWTKKIEDLKCDILLLTNLFEKFINNNLDNYGLCPSRYLSAQALSWVAMLNMTKVELELITDPDI